MNISAIMRKQGALYKSIASNNLIIRQLMRISVIVAFLIITGFSMLLAFPANGQSMATEKVSVGLNNESLETAIKKIEQQTSLRFYYRHKEIKDLTNLNLPLDTRTIEQTLNALFQNTFFSFKQIDKNILIQKADSISGYEIQGRAIDQAHKGVDYATISIKKTKSNQILQSTIADTGGHFKFIVKEKGDYLIKISAVGMDSLTVSLTLAEMKVVQLPDIVITPSSKQLKEVSITAQRPIIKQEIDRLVYDVQADPDNKMITALDMIGRVPLLSVDGMDRIQLRGSTKYKILINGRESAIMAQSPSDVLKSMPALNIEKIEVITTPPSKYDAEGLAGIINIITKRNTDQGYNVSTNARYLGIFGPGFNTTVTVKEGKFGVSAYGGVNYQLASSTAAVISNTQFSPDKIINQNSTELFHGNRSFGNADLSYEIDSLNLITASIQYAHAAFDHGDDQTSRQVNSLNNLTQGYQLSNRGNSSNQPIDVTINYELGFKKHKNELLTFSYQYSYAPHYQFDNNNFSDKFNYFQSQQPDSYQNNTSGSKVNTVQIDYVYPLKKINIELGSKAILRQNFSDFSRYDLDSATNNYIINKSQTGEFNYRQNVYSIYNSYLFKLNKWVVKGGLRLERTQLNALFTGTPLDRGYNNLIPAIAILRNFTGNSFSFGYTQRIQRPGIAQLNPYVDQTNPNFVNTGNPHLSPELNNTFDLTYGHYSKGSIVANLNYAFSNNAIQNVTFLTINNTANNTKDTITTTTYQNLGTNSSLGLNLSANYPISKRLSININTRITHVWLKGTFNGEFYLNDGYTGNANTTISYAFDNGYRLSVYARYITGNVTLQGKDPNSFSSTYTVSKNLFGKKANIAFIVLNPYSRFITLKAYTHTRDFAQTNYLQNYNRYFVLNVNYKFGRLNKDIKKNQRNINNDDIKN
jgi:outer membrane receptor for ferrienterochelin and colicin